MPRTIVDSPKNFKVTYDEYEPMPYYDRLAKPGKGRCQVEGLPCYAIFTNLSRMGHVVFWTLMAKREPINNIVEYIPTNSKDRSRMLTTYKELHDAQLIVRVKRGKYLINPRIYLPDNGSFDRVYKHWLSLTESKD